jgi:hypothetical protein
MSIRLYVRLDYPVKDAVIKVDDKATLTDLKAAVAKAHGISEADARKYTYWAVEYAKDAFELGKGTGGDSDALSENGVKEGVTIIGRAPAELKPIRKRKDKEEDEKKSTTSGSVSADRYKGLTVKNCLKKLVEKQGKHKLAMEFLEIYAKDIFKTKEFRSLSKDMLVLILKSDSLSIKEVEVFDAVLEWGKVQAKEQKLDAESADDMKKILTDVLPLVRFPAMTTTDVAVKVTNSGLLDSDQILDLFTYLGMKTSSSGKTATLGKSLKAFNSKDRKGRKPPAWFKWDTNKKYSMLSLSDDGLTVTSTSTSYYQPIVGDLELTEGVWEYEVVLQQFYVYSYSVCIGAVASSWSNWSSSGILGYSGHITQGYSFGCGSGVKYDGTSSGVSYGRTCAQGDVIRVKIDVDKRTIEYSVNGSSLGVAHTNITTPVRPCMSLYGSNTIKLQFPS